MLSGLYSCVLLTNQSGKKKKKKIYMGYQLIIQRNRILKNLDWSQWS